jgi:hypothetical protein
VFPGDVEQDLVSFGYFHRGGGSLQIGLQGGGNKSVLCGRHKFLNSKSETRNPKQKTMFKIQMTETNFPR